MQILGNNSCSASQRVNTDSAQKCRLKVIAE